MGVVGEPLQGAVDDDFGPLAGGQQEHIGGVGGNHLKVAERGVVELAHREPYAPDANSCGTSCALVLKGNGGGYLSQGEAQGACGGAHKEGVLCDAHPLGGANEDEHAGEHTHAGHNVGGTAVLAHEVVGVAKAPNGKAK